ncbi:MAG: YggS family pyridoxal phosphate-dependent enzyme [Xanthomonadales bacterium]|nr:YggS family pyridoxal phosphate-dependent enzyme [Xanthomonadales bacterium]
MNESLKRLNLVQQRIEKACLSSGRQPGEVSLLAVSKWHPAEKITALNKLGVRSFGENQLQEALKKQQELTDLDLQWHFIGVLQSNKTRAIAENFHWVQSVDRQKILKRLSAQRPDSLQPINVCLQVNIDLEPQKSGANPEEILQLAALAHGLDNIRLRGLMAIPRVTTDSEEQHDSFRRVKVLFEMLKNEGHDIDTLSMGMSSDLEIAICEGSTMVRIGTDLFGKRRS